jgi:prolipoprotein diacylglyceryltransferase
MFFATLLFLVLYLLSRKRRRLGILTLTFGAWYGATRVLEDFLRVDKRFFGLTGSQWTGLAVSLLCLITLLVWAIRAPRGDRGGGGAGLEPVGLQHDEPRSPPDPRTG